MLKYVVQSLPPLNARVATTCLIALLSACGTPPPEPSTPNPPATAVLEPAPEPPPNPPSTPAEEPTAAPPLELHPDARALRFEGVDPTPADPDVVVCTGNPPEPGTPLRQVNLCDLLAEDVVRELDHDKHARYELISAQYADIRPTWSSANATLCAGDEAVLLVDVYPEGSDSPRQCVQLRCASSFPPDPARVGKNGEFCRSRVNPLDHWLIRPGRVEAHYSYGVEVWTMTPVGEDYQFIRR